MFQKGHTINLGRKNPNAGRKKSPRNQIRAIFGKLLPDCEAEIGELALHSDNDRVRFDACSYIRDCERGRPHQSQDLRVSLLKAPSGDDYELGMGWVDREDKKLMDKYGGSQNLLKEGSQDVSEQEGSQGIHEEA